MEIKAAQEFFRPEPGWLNTASYGLPPNPAWDALQAALDEWRGGRTSWKGWGETTGRAREAFARIVGVSPSDVSVGAQVSQLLGMVASSMPDGTRVVVPEEEFTSNLFPWLVQERRGFDIRAVPTADLAHSITDDTDVVAFSLVQSATGEIADVDAVVAAAEAAGALT
ncbi:aminotransferase class V-fold PLP-dependent enzyme, partial [Phytoactinopolyspora endophytica]|uniref:aminotransferase class V-fold PLP-dependent enzyme n=1 Tax=Phytoactinopolyspora endophytica TaxID=1642495 RepID=UPI00197B80BE